MAKFGRGPEGEFKKFDPLTRKEKRIRVTQVDVGSKPLAEGFRDKLQEMADKEKARAQEQPGIQLDAFGSEGLEKLGKLAAKSHSANLLKQAQKLIRDQRFEEALIPLGQLREAEPDHPEAIFLTAYCLVRLDKPKDALRELSPLLKVPVAGKFGQRVKSLRDRIRDELRRSLMVEQLLAMATEEYQPVINALTDLVELDSTYGMFRYHLAGTLMLAGRLADAQTQIMDGLAVCEPDQRNRLNSLRGEIEKNLARTQMTRARDLYRRGDYERARTELKGLDAVIRTTALCRIFDAYLAQLAVRLLWLIKLRRRPTDIRPSGSPEEVEALYEFLTEPDIVAVNRSLDAGESDQAEAAARCAVELAPDYAYANFLYGLSAYRRLGDQVTSPNPPPLDEAIAELEGVRGHAARATHDEEIAAAPALCEAIDGLISSLQEVRSTLNQVAADVERVNGVIEVYNQVMERAEETMKSPKGVTILVRELEAARNKVNRAKGKVQDDNGTKALRNLSQAIDQNLKDLGKIQKAIAAQKKDADVVNDAVSDFNKIMALVGDGIQSPKHYNKVFGQLVKLKNSLPARRRELKNEHAIAELDKLRDAVARHHERLTGMRKDVEQSKEIAALVARFNSKMNELTSAKGLLPHQALSAHSYFESLQTDVRNLRQRISGADGRQVLDSLLKAVNNALDQLRML